jgi:hypothetical protein
MSVTAAEAFRALKEALAIDSSPRLAREWITEISLTKGWATSLTEAQVIGEHLQDGLLVRARRTHNTDYEAGRLPDFAFNSSSGDMIQGPCFVEPSDDAQVRDAKLRRRTLGDYVQAFLRLTPYDFEVLCRGLLAIIGVAKPEITRRTRDEGIDFYGRWDVGDTLRPLYELPGGHRLLRVWLVGQAKRYDSTQVATPDIRELVGAVSLARVNAYSRQEDPYPDLTLRLCDPVFFIFATSGDISADSWELLKQSGVIGFDGNMVAALLADNDVAQVNGKFDQASFDSWLKSYRPA